MQVVLYGVSPDHAPTKANMSLFEMGGIFTQYGRTIQVGMLVGLLSDHVL